MAKIAPRVIILDGDRVITGSGRVTAAPPGGTSQDVLSRLSGALGCNGQVLITGNPGWEFLADPDVPGDWTVSGTPGWKTARRGNSLLRIGIIPQIKPGNSPMLDHCADLSMIAVRHQLFSDLTGVTFYGDGGTTALVLLDEVLSVRGREPLRKWADERAPRCREGGWPGGSGWPAGGPVAGLLTVDRNAQYLAGVASVYVPLDAPERTGPVTWDPSRAGLWQVVTPGNPEPRLPHPCGPGARPGELAWYAHPTVELLAQLGAVIEVADSWTLPRLRCRRVMDEWYARLRMARAELLPAADAPDVAAVLQAVKDVYSRGISHLGKSPERRWYRKDWEAIYLSSARTRMWRAMHAAGVTSGHWPVYVTTDAVTYASTAAGAALKIGTGIGEWKVRP
jgi:hypothetical protein